MDYQESLRYLNRLGNEVLTMKFGLDTVRALLRSLGDPQSKFPCILVAGTNGKGSTARFIDSICRQAGIRTGLFTSPHLIRIEERIRISGAKISQCDFAKHLSEVVAAIDQYDLPEHPTFFEIITGTALQYFGHQGIDLGILEVGMGGRLDSTNTVDPILSVITPISYDHQQYLGDTLDLIAKEKSGIMRPGKPVISAPQDPEVHTVLECQAKKVNALLEFIELNQVVSQSDPSGFSSFSVDDTDFTLEVAGDVQVCNAVTALRVIEHLKQFGFNLDTSDKKVGIRKAHFPGVIQVLGKDPLLVLDGGHNSSAIETLCRFLRSHTSPPRTLVFGMMGDKEISSSLDKLNKLFSKIYLTQADRIRATSVTDLRTFCPWGIPIEDPTKAFQEALSHGSTVVVAGSLHLVGAVLKSLGSVV